MKTYRTTRHLLVDIETATAVVDWADRPDAEEAAELLNSDLWVTVTDADGDREVEITLTAVAVTDLREIAGLEDEYLFTMWKVVIVEVLENPTRMFRWGTPPAGTRLLYTSDRIATAGIQPHTPAEARYSEFWGYSVPADGTRVAVFVPKTWTSAASVEVIEWSGDD